MLVRAGTSTDDIAAMARADGILTGAGGRTSHAAVVARELGKPCLVGCAELEIDLEARTATIGPGRSPRATRSASTASPDSCSPAAPGRGGRPTAELAAVAAWPRAHPTPEPRPDH